jgi:putative glutamine amidotransferase
MPIPTVAVVIGREPNERYSIHRGYIDAIHAAGGRAVLIPAVSGGDVDSVLDVIEGAQATVLTGGDDVAPARYGESAHPKVAQIDTDRDGLELAAVEAAWNAGRRVLGICRGIQLLAVAFGGALEQDLPSAGFTGHWDEEHQYEPVHPVEVEPGSTASQVLAGARVVNSIHHQAVARPGPFLRATAWSADGVIEAVEAEGLLGLQWHPERLLTHDRRHLAPFRWVLAS